MAFSETIWLDRAILEAQAGFSDAAFPLADADSVARSLMEEVLHELSSRMAADPAQRGVSSKSFTLTLASDGEDDLDADLLFEALDQASFEIDGVDLKIEPMTRLQHRADAIGYLPDGFHYFYVQNNKIYFRDESFPLAAGTVVTMYAPRHYAKTDLAANIPEQWQDWLVSELARRLLAKSTA